jgi:hypothetical protein
MKNKIPTDNVKLKRAYEPPAADDGTRILIDRLWPRGITKKRAAIHQWMKDISPSTESAMIPPGGMSFVAVMQRRCVKTIFSVNCALSHGKNQSRWYIQLMTRSTTMPSN